MVLSVALTTATATPSTITAVAAATALAKLTPPHRLSFCCVVPVKRYSDLNQSSGGQIKSGPSGSGVGIITALLMAVSSLVVVVKAVRVSYVIRAPPLLLLLLFSGDILPFQTELTTK